MKNKVAIKRLNFSKANMLFVLFGSLSFCQNFNITTKYNSTFLIDSPSQQHVNDSVYEHHYQSDNKTDVIIWVRTRVPIKKLNPIARHFVLRYVVSSVTESHIGEQALKNAASLVRVRYCLY